MRFGKLEIEPARNPAILDTATWDTATVRQVIEGAEMTYLAALADALRAGALLPARAGITPFEPSISHQSESSYVLARLSDGQQVFLEVGEGVAESRLGAPIAGRTLPGGRHLRAHASQADVLDKYLREMLPDRGPQALGAVPRLGLGARMTTAFWPAAYRAMGRCGFAANTIQNSIRELNLLEDVLAAAPSEDVYYPGFGSVASGHTGSTFEGLWVYGALEALKCEQPPAYGADADHIKVSQGEAGLAAAKRWLKACRLYTFFTLDVSPILDYAAVSAPDPDAAQYLDQKINSLDERRELRAHYQRSFTLGGLSWRFDEPALGRMVGKYWDALGAMQELAGYIDTIRAGRPFDLEFAIDERQPQIPTCDCITTGEEVAFVLLECRRRGIPMTHLAPNFGVEKGVDYRCPDGLKGLAERVKQQSRMAAEHDVILDFHSGDDLSASTRQVIRRAAAGHLHFKVSPEPQMIFAETVHDMHPEVFERWWADAREYAQREAAVGSTFAAGCILEFESSGKQPSVRDSIFHNFGFGYVGRRDENGQYMHREELYSLSEGFHREYESRIEAYLCDLAQDLLQTT